MEVRHEDAACQGNKPICGIYAFLNGLLYEKGEPIDRDKKKTIKKIALEIWKIIINNDYASKKYSNNINALEIGIKGTGIYSVLGEFFSAQNLIDFLDNNHNEIKLILENNGVKNIDYKKINKYINFPDTIDNNLNTFYLVPINSFKKSSTGNRNNMHWICVKYEEDKLIILNSDKKFKLKNGYPTEKHALNKNGYNCNEISSVEKF